ncbi:MAG: hypothetical protein H6740_29495, partial [Alphaproteobacteria bacterium]|nr:hypothetical protein [Alphaproteobacteria bacterium]
MLPLPKELPSLGGQAEDLCGLSTLTVSEQELTQQRSAVADRIGHAQVERVFPGAREREPRRGEGLPGEVDLGEVM